MGTSQSSHAKYDNNIYSSSKAMKSVGSTSVGGRKKYSKWLNDHSAPHGLVGSITSHTETDHTHTDFDISERFSEHMNHHEIDLREVTSNDVRHSSIRHSCDFSSIEEDDESSEWYDSDEDEQGKNVG